MSDRRDDMFRVKPRPPKSAGGAVERRFLSRVKMEIGKLGGAAGRRLAGTRGRGGRRGRGQTTAQLMDANQGPRARRVVVKTRLVVFKQAGPRSAAMHLRYIVRDGASRDGAPAQAFGADTDSADVKAFDERCHGDRHHFRFIVAPEDGVELQDLRGFTRELMRRMERDLGTRLEWVAVDHWDTDNPHSHVVVRGKDEKGENLVIGREYISHGMRTRAGEIATEWLGPRTDLEIQQSLRRDVEQERWTGLDRELQSRCQGGFVNLSVNPKDVDGLRRRALLLGRLQRLQEMNLARQAENGGWALRDDLESVLRRLGERGDIIRTMQRALGGDRREYAIVHNESPGPVVGRIAAKGLADELQDRAYLIVDGLDGRAHYVPLPKSAYLAELPVGGIVEVQPGFDRVADRNIASMAPNGYYRPRDHLKRLRGARGDAEDIVTGHVRRLEALRRAGIAERVADGLWRVPSDLVEKGRAYDRGRLGGVAVELHSHLPIERQVRAIGATWLDHQLVGGGASQFTAGFGADARDAVRARVDFLVEQGLAERRDQRAFVAPSLLKTLRDRELVGTATQIARETGLAHRPVTDGMRVSGIYRRSVTLVSGRFAMLADGLGFSLVPWRPVIERQLGHTLSAVVRGGTISWQLGRQRGLSL